MVGIISEEILERVWGLFDGILGIESTEITEGILWIEVGEVVEEIISNCELKRISEEISVGIES